MNESKEWYESRTVWAGFLSMICGIAGLFGIQFTPEGQSIITELLMSLGAAGGGIGAIVSRVKATKIIRSIPNSLIPAAFLALSGALLLGMPAPANAQDTESLQWTPPTQRENGETLTQDEIGGYELRAINSAD